ncbi:YoaK family protein [Nonomuraea longispora]|nr:YoaK family protein [Nonomuraea longispora]
MGSSRALALSVVQREQGRRAATSAILIDIKQRDTSMGKGSVTPARSIIRDWLLVALSFSTGVYDAICFLFFGKVFTAFQTGNIVFLGLAFGGIRPPAGPNLVYVVISLGGFIVGGALAMRILRKSRPQTHTEGKDTLWSSRVSVTLAAGLALQIIFLVVWMTTSRSTEMIYIMVATGAMSMGMQMNAIESLQVQGVSTTALTVTVGLLGAVATRSLTLPAARRMIGGIMGVTFGAFLGSLMLSHANLYAPLVPVLVTTLVIAIASRTLIPRR